MNRVGRRTGGRRACPERSEGTKFTHKILLVIVLATLMGAGSLAGANSAPNDPAQKQTWTNTLISIAPAPSSASWHQSSPYANCPYERSHSAPNSTNSTNTPQKFPPFVSMPVKE